MTVIRTSSRVRASLLASFGVLTLFLLPLLRATNAASIGEEEILANYRPLAIDESWKLVGPKSNRVFKKEISKPLMSKESPVQTLEYPSAPTLSDVSPERARSVSDLPKSIEEKLSDVKDWNAASSDRLYKLPSNADFSPSVITSNKRDPTTFLNPEVHLPLRTEQNDKNDKIIARYRIVVPIFIPAFKKKHAVSTEKPVKYVKKVVTEMMPIKQSVPHVKEIVKAERMPQSLVTDFVSAEDGEVPVSVDDKIRPHEQLLSSIVQNVD